MDSIQTSYDAVIIGGGHNGLVAACYLAGAGKSVLVLERNAEVGGATRSAQAFPGVEARLSVYSYLVSLLPEKIVRDLGLNLQLRSRRTSSWTPSFEGDDLRDLLIRNDAPERNREAFADLTGGEADYRGYLELQEMQSRLASVLWPSLTSPLVTRDRLREGLDREGRKAWKALIEEPIGNVIEKLIAHDLIRGLVFTDARIGVSTYPDDPSLLQNRSFLYHVIGRGTGEWQVPVGGMGALVIELLRVARATGKVTICTGAQVVGVDPGGKRATVGFRQDGEEREVEARFVLCNASADVLQRLLGRSASTDESPLEGAGFKMNMLLERLPRLRAGSPPVAEAFAGTVHIDEGYEQMRASYQQSQAGEIPTRPPGEIYCHTLTDDSILSEDLRRRGFHSLTLFGLDMPHRLFAKDNARVREEVQARYLAGIDRFLAEPIEGCLARDANGAPCIESMSPVDLEEKIHLPRGNIFHGDLTWPFTDEAAEVGQWGVETAHPNILLCGSSAKRGGAVSGIPGHNAARKILEEG